MRVVEWAEALMPKIIFVENVEEFLDWGPLNRKKRPIESRKGETFMAWKCMLESLGYTVDQRILCAADFGAPTTRKRLFVQAVRGKREIVWPKPTHAPLEKLTGNLKPWVPARDVIDWRIPGESIYDRKTPLKPKTMKRIWVGLLKHGFAPYIVPGYNEKAGQQPRTHDIRKPAPTVAAQGHMHLALPYLVKYHGSHKGKKDGENRVYDVNDPIQTLDTSNRYGVAQPFLITIDHHSMNAKGARSAKLPLSTITTKQKHSLVQSYLVKLRGKNIGSKISTPVHTVTAGGTHIAIANPYLVQVNRPNGKRVRSVNKPLPTVLGNRGEQALCIPLVLPHMSSGKARHVNEPFATVMPGSRSMRLFQGILIKYYGNSDAQTLDKPLGSLTVKDRYALARPIVVINGEEYVLDILFRMLQPHELAGAQSFSKKYKFTGTKTEQVKQIGNAVPPKLAEALCKAALKVFKRPVKKTKERPWKKAA